MDMSVVYLLIGRSYQVHIHQLAFLIIY
uniref:Uncharacterized protein n=1 Tax=Lepeophtheirus salmonis TaxID=72036 RepID=A0A0K2TFJ1_LEPSM